MPQTMKDADGNEISAYTAEEVETMKTEKETALQKAQDELKAKEEALSKLKEKDLNFSNLRSQKEDAEKRIKEMSDEIKNLPEKVKGEVMQTVLKEQYNEALNQLSGGDEGLKAKIEHHYGRLSDQAGSKAEIEKKLRDALSLSQDRVDGVGNAFASMSSAPLKPSGTDKTWSDEDKAFAKKFAAAGNLKLTDEDFKAK